MTGQRSTSSRLRRPAPAALRARLEPHLRQALAGDELVLGFQPIVDVASHRIVGAEALLAWESPVLGRVPAGRFIPVAEDSGLIHGIGDWVLEASCRMARDWPAPAGRPIRLAVNISARQVIGGGLVERVEKTLETTGLAPDRLALELTERLLIDDGPETRRALASLAAMGIRLSIDDFGTGYSALAYLIHYPFEILKIDRGFVRQLLDRRRCRAVVEGILAMSRSLAIEVVAEGVETRAQLELLAAMGCERVQGFYFSRAVPAVELGRMLAHDGGRLRSEVPPPPGRRRRPPRADRRATPPPLV